MLFLATSACSEAPDPGPGGTWVGTITTEGNVTTVVNESGSVWGGTATLVEELSIGVESGEEPYLLGTVAGVGVANDQIFALDAQVLRVRVYDENGAHVMDLGREGDGPGEFRRPTGFAVGTERVFVRDPQLGRISVFSVGGELLDTWPTRAFYTPVPIVATASDELFIPARGGMALWGPEGAVGPPVSAPAFASSPPMMTIRVTETIPGLYSAGAMVGRRIPFWPAPAWVMSATGALVYGDADEYQFTIEHPNGERIIVESRHHPVAVGDAEAAWHRSWVRQHMRQADAGWQWDGPEIPATKPVYTTFVPARSGEVWVVRPGPGYLASSNCEALPGRDPPEACWKDSRLVDVFGADGRFEGEVHVPPELAFEPRPVIDSGMVVGVVQDEAGTIMVKRYRLVLPGEEEQ